MSAKFRNLIRAVALLGAVGLLAYGLVSGAVIASPTEPPNDRVWLLTLAGAFPLLLIYTMLTVAGRPGVERPTPEERFRRNVQQLGGSSLITNFVIVGLLRISA